MTAISLTAAGMLSLGGAASFVGTSAAQTPTELVCEADGLFDGDFIVCNSPEGIVARARGWVQNVSSDEGPPPGTRMLAVDCVEGCLTGFGPHAWAEVQGDGALGEPCFATVNRDGVVSEVGRSGECARTNSYSLRIYRHDGP